MSRRVLGGLLVLGWPGLLSGISLTAYHFLSDAVATPLSVANWLAAAIGSGVGGYFAPADDDSRRGAAFCGLMLGAGIYYATMVMGDFLSWHY